MSQQTFLKTAGVVFAVVGVFHVLRLFLGWDVVIGGGNAPRWVSWLAAAFAGYLSYTAFKLAK